MAIQNKLLQIEREAQQIVRLANIGAQTAVKLDLNETTIKIINNKGTVVSTYNNAGRKERGDANLAASALDIAKPDDAPHVIESKSAITFKEDGTIDFGDASFGDLFPTAEVERMIYDIETYTDCENIKQFIKDHTKVLEDQIKAAVPEIANLSEINGLLSIPSNPLKILRWARKVVSKFFGPYTLAMIDLALQLALFAGALARLAGAAAAAQQNLKLCAYEIAEEAIDSVLNEINEQIGGTIEKIDNVLDKIDTAQNAIANVTGKPTRFYPQQLSGGLSGLTQNLTDETRSQLITKLDEELARAFPTGSKESFVADINEIVNRDIDDDAQHPEAQADLDAFANTAGQALQGNTGFSTTLLTSAGAFSGNTAVPGDSSSGVDGEFEIITGKGSFDQVRYLVRNGIITNVTVGL